MPSNEEKPDEVASSIGHPPAGYRGPDDVSDSDRERFRVSPDTRLHVAAVILGGIRSGEQAMPHAQHRRSKEAAAQAISDANALIDLIDTDQR